MNKVAGYFAESRIKKNSIFSIISSQREKVNLKKKKI